MPDFVDLTSAEVVEIRTDGTRLWVDTEGGNVLRIYNIRQLVITDLRQKQEETNADRPDLRMPEL